MPDVKMALGFTALCPFAGCPGEPVDMHNSFLHCVLCGPLCVLCSIQVRFPCLESDVLAHWNSWVEEICLFKGSLQTGGILDWLFCEHNFSNSVKLLHLNLLSNGQIGNWRPKTTIRCWF